MQIAQALALGIVDEVVHQRPAEPGPLQIAAHDHGIFGAHIVWVGLEPRHAEQLALIVAERDEGHGAAIVDLREAGVRLVRELLARSEEAEADVLRREPGLKLCKGRLVRRPDRPDQDAQAALRFGGRLPAVGIGPDREPRIWRRHVELVPLDANAGVERDHAGLVGEQRIDVELAQGRAIHHELR